MAIPDFATTGLSHACQLDTWKMSDISLDPLETDMDGGNKRRRARPGDNTQRIQFSILYTQAQWMTLFAFNRDTLVNGCSRFTMIVWMGGAFESHTVQFAGKLNPQSVELKVQANFDLWVFNE